MTALYDAQCEICQAMKSWIRLLDPGGVIDCVALDAQPLPELHRVVERRDPVVLLTEKLGVLRWVRAQVEEGLHIRAIEASCFPWGMRWSWEKVVADETARLLTGGEFSRSELVRSFRRHRPAAMLADVLTLRVVIEASG